MSSGSTGPSLADRIRSAEHTGAEVFDELKTDERVLARITDGIYRQPASALRELIANAYDADASTVVIETDAPRFDRVVIRDDGSGMSSETLGHVLHHIGGSLKRTRQGADHSVTDADDPASSPGGRKLIGKIGIGLFSVAQLTPHFQVITKRRGEAVRRVADIVLAPEDVEKALAEGGVETQLKTGSVRVWSVPAADVEAHGTEIVLMDLRPQTKDLLRSSARWAALKPSHDGEDESWMPTATVAPVFHIGGVAKGSKDVIEVPEALPWKPSDDPKQKFQKLVDAVHSRTKVDPNPELEKILDNYLRLMWTLSLALPSSYMHAHPFDLSNDANVGFHLLSNEPRGQASDLELSDGVPVRDVVGLSAPADFEDENFHVLVDGVQLSRPLVFGRFDPSANTKKGQRALMFIGKASPDLSRVPEAFRGGRLRFEAYLYWTPKIVPKEHNGVLVRVKGASGTLFDPTFMGYQVSEQTRLKQISAEIFIHEGLEGALNIDRESFNYASIHFQFISRWLHGAIRQLTNRHKSLSSKVREQRRAEEAQLLDEVLRDISEAAWTDARSESPDLTPEVLFDDSQSLVESARSTGVAAYHRSSVVPAVLSQKVRKYPDLVSRMKAIAVVLQAYGAFDNMSYERQEQVLREIGKIIAAEASDAN